MTSSYTTSFTETHARYLASKAASDLRQMQLYYYRPSNEEIIDYAVEIAVLLLNQCLEAVEYGFRRDGRSVVALKYRATHGLMLDDNRSGRVPAGANVSGASWYSFLWHSQKWSELSQTERKRIEDALPFTRTSGDEPVAGDGAWTTDRSYSSESVNLQRSTFRPA